MSIRRHVLEDEVDGHRLILPARRLADEGLTAWSEVLARGYEGLVAKDPATPYVGGRTLKWLKVKQPRYREGERVVTNLLRQRASYPLAARRTWGRRGRCRCGRHPYPGIGDRHPIALQVVAAAGVADVLLD